MFRHIRTYIAIKSIDKQGIIEGFEDMVKEGKVPFISPFQHENVWILLIVEYKKSELWAKN
tara:strand:- start:1281 stop:1463 length:183 start_codon:yes stop_codon:yes gene_type:complete